MKEVLVIERDNPSCDYWDYLKTNNRLENLTVEEVLSKYQGFEGEIIAKLEVVNNKKDSQKISSTFGAKRRNIVMLQVLPIDDCVLKNVLQNAFKVGYEYGICEADTTIYSSIYNEILFGHVEKLVAYKDLLNEHLLFPDYTSAKEYVNLHHELSLEGEGVEHEDFMNIYQVWKYHGFDENQGDTDRAY